MPDFLVTCEQAARLGGATLMSWFGRIRAREKGPRDLVTEADLASQQAIREFLLDIHPDHGFLGEEDEDFATPTGTEYRWVVDPLDGTANYVHGMQQFAVSVALEKGGQPLAGAVYDPIADECYTAARSTGAFLNGEKINASGCQDLEQAMVAASFSANVPRDSIEVRRFVEVLHAAQTTRRLGSATLNLCYVAAGRLDAYFATSVKIWDVAAGLLLVSEAGGVASNLEGGEINLSKPEFLASATPQLQESMLATLRAANRERS